MCPEREKDSFSLKKEKINSYLEEFKSRYPVVEVFFKSLALVGVGIWPVVDHLLFRVYDGTEKTEELLSLGYVLKSKKVAHESRGSLITSYAQISFPDVLVETPAKKGVGDAANWIDKNSESELAGMAIRVEEIEKAVYFLEKQNIKFYYPIHGARSETLRWIKMVLKEAGDQSDSAFFLLERRGAWDRYPE